MIDRIMLYVAPGPEGAAAARWALVLARRFGARVFAVTVIDPARSDLPSEWSPTTPPTDGDKEEEAWKMLYEIEDDAFELDVKLSLVLEQGDPVKRFVELGTGYAGDLFVAPTGWLRPDELVAQSPAPVVFVRSFKEER